MKAFLLIFQLSVEDFTRHADVYNPNSDGGAFKNVKVNISQVLQMKLASYRETGILIFINQGYFSKGLKLSLTYFSICTNTN